MKRFLSKIKESMSNPKYEEEGGDEGYVELDTDAEDVKEDDDTIEIIFSPEKFGIIKEKINENNLPSDLLELTMVPQTAVPLQEKEAIQMLKLMDALEEMEDIQNIYANFDISEEIMEKVS